MNWVLGRATSRPHGGVAAVSASLRLDDALRGLMTEQGTKRVAKEQLWRLVGSTMRLRLTAHSLAIAHPAGSGYETTRDALTDWSSGLLQWYRQVAGDLDGTGAATAEDLFHALPAIPAEVATPAGGLPTCMVWVSQHLLDLRVTLTDLIDPVVEVSTMRRRGGGADPGRHRQRQEGALDPLVHFPGMPASWNPLDPQFKVDPYPSYRSLIEEDPFHRSPFGPLVLSRYDDCLTMLRHPAASSDLRKIPGWQAPPGIEPTDITPSFLSLDPPDHTRLRALVAKAFTPRRAEALRPLMQQIVEGLVDEAAERGSMEVVADLAFPLPVLVICELLGVPPEDVDEFKEWSAAVARTLDPPFLIPEEVLSSAQAAAARAEAYFKHLIAERRHRPSDDLISALIVAEESGDQLSEAEMLSTLGLLLIAGHETTVNLIANGVLAFARQPDQFTRLRDEPALIRSAVEEILRFDPRSTPMVAWRSKTSNCQRDRKTMGTAGDPPACCESRSRLLCRRRFLRYRPERQPPSVLWVRDPPLPRRPARPGRSPGGAGLSRGPLLPN